MTTPRWKNAPPGSHLDVDAEKMPLAQRMLGEGHVLAKSLLPHVTRLPPTRARINVIY